MKSRHIIIVAALLGTAWPLAAMAGSGDNALRTDAQAAMAKQNWSGAAGALKMLDSPKWPDYQALSDVDFNMQKFQDASDTADKAIAGVQGDSAMPADKLAVALGQMYEVKGNALQQLGKDDDAIAAYNSAAKNMTNPGSAYLSICAMEFNDGGKPDEALSYCDKAIAADPNLADAYFIKGSLLFKQAKNGPNNSLIAPPGTAEAFQKYLDLAPVGGHAGDAKDMLGMVKPAG